MAAVAPAEARLMAEAAAIAGSLFIVGLALGLAIGLSISLRR